jgi:hypothetical protein
MEPSALIQLPMEKDFKEILQNERLIQGMEKKVVELLAKELAGGKYYKSLLQERIKLSIMSFKQQKIFDDSQIQELLIKISEISRVLIQHAKVVAIPAKL